MNKKIIITIPIIALAVIGVVAWGYGNSSGLAQTQSNRSSSLTASEALYDFGTISMANGKVSHLFHITNPTDKDIKINKIETSCMCTNAYFINGDAKDGPFGMPGMGGSSEAHEVIPAHGTRDIEAVYDPNAHGPSGVGDIDRTIDVGEKNGGTLQLEIKAVVTP